MLIEISLSFEHVIVQHVCSVMLFSANFDYRRIINYLQLIAGIDTQYMTLINLWHKQRMVDFP